MSKRLALFLLPSFFVLFVLPSAARADPIIIPSPLAVTGGSLTLSRSGLIGFAFQGQGVSFQGRGDSFVSPSPWSACIGACPGTMNLGSTFADNLSGTTVINGTTYNVSFGGLLRFNSSDVTIPPGSTSPLTFVQPFTFSGFLSDNPMLGPRIFSYALSGQGVATLHLVFNPAVGRYEFDSLAYNFTAATPEPATLLLLGTGLAGVAAAARRRRKAAREFAREG